MRKAIVEIIIGAAILFAAWVLLLGVAELGYRHGVEKERAFQKTKQLSL